MPERNTPEYYAMGLIDEMLIEGDDSILHQELVQKRGYTGKVSGGINLLGTPWNYYGPMLFITNLIHDPGTTPDMIVQTIDSSLEPLRTKPVDQKTLDRALVKLRSDLYDTIGGQGGFGLVDLLASFALFDDNPARVNSLVAEYEKVTPALIQKTAQEYLRPENRTVLLIEPGQQPHRQPAPNLRATRRKINGAHDDLDTQNEIVDLEALLFVGGIAAGVTRRKRKPPAAQKQTPPPGGPPKAFNVPAHETYTLPNGMRVTLVPYGNIPKVDHQPLCAGGKSERAARTSWAVADITGELLKEGTKTLNAKALAETIAGMGSSLDLRVGEDETAVDVDVLSEYGAAAIKLMADFAMHPLLPESEFPRLKANLLRQVVVAKSRPGQIALARFRKLMYGDHPYGEVLPTEESLNKMTIEDTRKFYADNYGAERAHLYVAGKFDVGEVKKAIAETFSSWTKGTAPVVNAPKPKMQRLLDVTDRPNAPQSTIYVGLPVADATNPDNIPLIVTNSLLGGSFGSRITSNIREQKGYTYSPSSQVSRRYHDAYWAEIADVTTAATGPSLKEIFGEIDRLQKEAPGACGAERHSELFVGSFCDPEFDTTGAHRTIALCGFAGAGRGLPEDFCAESECGYARRCAEDDG